MTSMLSFAAPFAAIAIAALSGCATTQDKEHDQHHPQTAVSQPATTMSSGASGDQTGMMDMKSMCDMHRKMMSAKTSEERQTMMDERMKNMSPEMRQKHMAMMQEKCK